MPLLSATPTLASVSAARLARHASSFNRHAACCHCQQSLRASSSSSTDQVGAAVAHQKLSAGEDQRTVRTFLEGHRMSHILNHDDLHQTMTRLASQSEAPPPAAPAKRPSALAAARFAGRVSVVTGGCQQPSTGHGAASASRGPERIGSARSSHSRRVQASIGRYSGAAATTARRQSTTAVTGFTEITPVPAEATLNTPGRVGGSATAAAAAVGDISVTKADDNRPTMPVSGLLARGPRERACDVADEDCAIDARLGERCAGALSSEGARACTGSAGVSRCCLLARGCTTSVVSL